jgi:hypothetical protein
MAENPNTTLGQTLRTAVDEAVTAALNETGGVRPLRWSLRRADATGRPTAVIGQASSDYVEHEIPDVLAEWVAALSLTPAEPNPRLPGTQFFTGQVDDVDIEIWGVIDRVAWDAKFETFNTHTKPENQR